VPISQGFEVQHHYNMRKLFSHTNWIKPDSIFQKFSLTTFVQLMGEDELMVRASQMGLEEQQDQDAE